MSHYNNASLVEDGLKLVGISSRLAVSTVISYGFWYGICKSNEPLSILTGRFDLSDIERNNLQEVKSSFCNQLASIITSTEVALAGHVRPWPFAQPLRFVGTGFIAYRAHNNDNPYFTPIITMAYFTHEIVARTIAGASVIQALRNDDRPEIHPEDYAHSEYTMLKSIAGMMVGTIVHNEFIAKGSSRVEAIFAYVISASVTQALTSLFSLPPSNSGDSHAFEPERTAANLAGAGVIAGSIAGATAGAIAAGTAFDRLLFIAAVSTLSLSLPKFESSSQLKDKINAGAMSGLIVGAGVMKLLTIQNSNLDSNHLLRNVAITLAPALALALINGVSNYDIYGFSLEESFTETARNQWKKFYAPLDYLRTLFN
ncbi:MULTISPECIES: hypothetical protein [unclassified Endozoicomonas]|uniref:hypothetical protein n=1 Tax=unclassified Endozoicomonas TaxID=2644528 RepID=UPI002147E30D|nr:MULTISPECIES: hypothetical protein [unclassified Endozoicomonas]